eukprot:gene8246-10134_t
MPITSPSNMTRMNDGSRSSYSNNNYNDRNLNEEDDGGQQQQPQQQQQQQLHNNNRIKLQNEMNTLSLDKLSKEPLVIQQQKKMYINEMKSLALEHYKLFIENYNTLNYTHSNINIVSSKLDSMLEHLPQISNRCEQFSMESQSLCKSRSTIKNVLDHQSTLLDLLEIPQLIDTCIKNGNYDEALQLESFSKKLAKQFQNINLINDLVKEIKNSTQSLILSLQQSLRGNQSLTDCIKTIGYLRRLTLPLIKDGSSISYVLENSMYFSMSLSRVGIDFRSIMDGIFEKAILNYFVSQVTTSIHHFLETLKSWKFNLPKVSSLFESKGQQQNGNLIQAPKTITNYPPLMILSNSFAKSFNELRECLPLSLESVLLSKLRESIISIVGGVQAFHNQSSLTSDQEKIFLNMCRCLVENFLPHIVFCFDTLFNQQQQQQQQQSPPSIDLTPLVYSITKLYSTDTPIVIPTDDNDDVDVVVGDNKDSIETSLDINTHSSTPTLTPTTFTSTPIDVNEGKKLELKDENSIKVIQQQEQVQEQVHERQEQVHQQQEQVHEQQEQQEQKEQAHEQQDQEQEQVHEQQQEQVHKQQEQQDQVHEQQEQQQQQEQLYQQKDQEQELELKDQIEISNQQEQLNNNNNNVENIVVESSTTNDQMKIDDDIGNDINVEDVEISNNHTN